MPKSDFLSSGLFSAVLSPESVRSPRPLTRTTRMRPITSPLSQSDDSDYDETGYHPKPKIINIKKIRKSDSPVPKTPKMPRTPRTPEMSPSHFPVVENIVGTPPPPEAGGGGGGRIPKFMKEKFEDWKHVDSLGLAKQNLQNFKTLPMLVSPNISILDLRGEMDKGKIVEKPRKAVLMPASDFFGLLKAAIPLEQHAFAPAVADETRTVKEGKKKKKKGKEPVSPRGPVSPKVPVSPKRQDSPEFVPYKYESPILSPKSPVSSSKFKKLSVSKPEPKVLKRNLPPGILRKNFGKKTKFVRDIVLEDGTVIKVPSPDVKRLKKLGEQAEEYKEHIEVVLPPSSSLSLSPLPKKKVKPGKKLKMIMEKMEERAERKRDEGQVWDMEKQMWIAPILDPKTGEWVMPGMESKSLLEKKKVKNKKNKLQLIAGGSMPLQKKNKKCVYLEITENDLGEPVICNKTSTGQIRKVALNGPVGKKLMKKRTELIMSVGREVMTGLSELSKSNEEIIRDAVYKKTNLVPTQEELQVIKNY